MIRYGALRCGTHQSVADVTLRSQDKRHVEDNADGTSDRTRFARNGAARVVRYASEQRSIIGLTLYSSDGEKLGEVVHVGMYDGQESVLAETSAFFGMGSTAVLVPMDMVTSKAGRVELLMTADELRNMISNSKPLPAKPTAGVSQKTVSARRFESALRALAPA